LKRLDADAATLIVAVREGQLQERAVTDNHEGAYKHLLGGLNELVDSCATPIRDARNVLDKIAEKNLTERMAGDYRGEWGAIKLSLNKAADNLDDAMGQVVVAADQVTTAATEITIGSQSLAQAATEQASALDQVTSRLQSVTTSGKQTAGNAQEARGMAQAANDAASRGGKAMTELSNAIETIKTASDRTAQIVKTIDEIAFQTNLLALNAAVEAARAGDAGRGFAVVAEEVRNLAMRSAEAARSTSDMIEDAVKSAERGVTLNDSVAKSFGEIRDHVGRVVEVMAEIAAASQQQASGVSEINGMVDQVTRATQQNAATTEESASAAEELSGQAESLKELVAGFALKSTSQAARPQPRPAPAPLLRPAPTRKPGRVVHLRSVPPPAARAVVSKATQLIPFDDEEGARAMTEF
jgi:methyl-accepting chemotaxis protein